MKRAIRILRKLMKTLLGAALGVSLTLGMLMLFPRLAGLTETLLIFNCAALITLIAERSEPFMEVAQVYWLLVLSPVVCIVHGGLNRTSVLMSCLHIVLWLETARIWARCACRCETMEEQCLCLLAHQKFKERFTLENLEWLEDRSGMPLDGGEDEEERDDQASA